MMQITLDNFKGATDEVVGALTGLLKKRAEGFEVFISCSAGLSVEAKAGAVDAFRVSASAGLGLRTLSQGRPGVGFTTVFTGDALRTLVETTLSGSLGAADDTFLGFAAPPAKGAEGPVQGGAEGSPPLSVDDGAFGDATEEEKISRAIRMERSALDAGPLIKRVRKAAYSESRTETRTVNSNGVDAGYRGTFYSGSALAVAEKDGESQMGWEIGMGHKRADVDCERIGSEAARRAAGLLGARKPGTLRCPAVFENTVVTEFLGVLSSSFLADNVLKGKSMLAGKKGGRVVSRGISVIDDGLLKGGWSSSLFDCEGVARGKTPVITEGVCRGFLYDTYWALRDRTGSTGNAARGGYKGAPSPGVSNLYIEKGQSPLEGLLSDMKKGLFITEVMGVHTVNPVTGDFSLGASGMWVEDGSPAYPVRGIAIAGSLLELFSRVEAVGSDLRFLGSVGAPALLFGEIEASGS